MKLSTVANEINHEAEREGIAINKHFVINHLQLVPSGEHGLEGTARDLTQRRSADMHVLLAAHVQFYYGFEILYLNYPLLLLFPFFFLLPDQFSLFIDILATLLQFLQELHLTLFNQVNLPSDFLLKFCEFLLDLLAPFFNATRFEVYHWIWLDKCIKG